jgi:hypothetical protein
MEFRCGDTTIVYRAFLIAVLIAPAVAQSGPCTEEFVKSESAKHNPATTNDAYFFSGALERPVVGTAAAKKAFTPVATSRKLEKQDPLHPDRIVSAPSGEMAYEYGTGHMSFTERASGKACGFYGGLSARLEGRRRFLQDSRRDIRARR